MGMKQNYNFEALRKNLTDMMIEAQLKLGFAKDSVGLYYPLDSLNRLLVEETPESGVSAGLSVNEMEQVLKEFAVYAEDTLGKVECSHRKDRFCIRIPEEGAAYAKTQAENNGFLREFIDKIGGHHCDLEDLLAIFSKYSDHVEWEKMDGGEFDDLIYFKDGIPDDYRYCVTFEGGHATYHRFTPKDYEAFHFERADSEAATPSEQS